MSDDTLNPNTPSPSNGGDTPFSHNVFESPDNNTFSPLDAAVKELAEAAKASGKASEESVKTLKSIENVSKETLDVAKDKVDTDDKNRVEDEKVKAKDDKKQDNRDKLLEKAKGKGNSAFEDNLKGGSRKPTPKSKPVGDELVGVINTAAAAINAPMAQLDKVVNGFIRGAGNIFTGFVGGSRDRVEIPNSSSTGKSRSAPSPVGIGGASFGKGTGKDMGDSLNKNDPQALFFGSPERSPVGKFIASFFKKENALGKTSDGAVANSGGMGVFMGAIGAFILPLLGIVAVIGGLWAVFKDNKELLDNTMKSFSLLWDTLKVIIESIVSAFNTIIQAIDWEGVKGLIRQIADTVAQIVGALVGNINWDVIKKVVKDFGDLATKVMEGLMKVFGGIWDGMEPLRAFISDFINNMDWDALAGQFKTAFEQVSSVIRNIIEFVSPIIGNVKDLFFKVFGIIAKVFNSVMGVLKNLQPQIDMAFAVVGDIFSAVGAFVESLMPLAEWLLKIGIKGVSLVFGGIKNIFLGLSAGIKTLTDFFKDPGKFISGLLTSIKDGIMLGVQKVKDIFGGLWGRITSMFDSAWNGLKKGVGDASAVIQRVMDAIWTPLDKYIFSPIKGAFSSLMEGISSFFQPFIDTFRYIAEGEGITGQAGRLGNVMGAGGDKGTADFQRNITAFARERENSFTPEPNIGQKIKESNTAQREGVATKSSNVQNNNNNTTVIYPTGSKPNGIGWAR